MKKTSLILSLLAAMHAFSAEWKLVDDRMLTPWAKQVTPENAWQEYPRPQFQRESWKNLNGLWQYAVTPKDASSAETWNGSILVPFCPESALSGVGRLIEPYEALWYKRELPQASAGKRSLLHFEAVDYQTTVFVNGKKVGTHIGGHTPFSFDVTEFLTSEKNELVLRIDDATEGYQLHGKQKLQNGGIWYTRVTGIWQTVWMEEVSALHLTDVDYACDLSKRTITVTPKLSAELPAGAKIQVLISHKGKESARADLSKVGPHDFSIAEPALWSPDAPNLYDVQLSIIDAAGKLLDSVKSYTAMRAFGKAKDSGGHWRYTLNGKSIFHWGPLDQGWWPDGLLTPPSDAAMLSDIEYLKAAGFNMIRKHIKVEPRRYYYHCDRLGMMMWQDQVSNSYGPRPDYSPEWTRMAPNPQDANWPDAAHEQYLIEYKRMIDHLHDAPCIASWVPFNEAWGQHRTMEVGKMAVAYDSTRAINIASGGNFWPIGDVADHHNYPHPDFPLDDKRFNDYIKVVGEFGGHGWPVDGHLWKKDNANWGYGGLPKSLDEWKDRYTQSINILCGLRKRGIAAGVYTQTTDVEIEINGLRTYDRVNKVEPSWLKPLSDKLLGSPDVVRVTSLLSDSRAEAHSWRFSLEKPTTAWESESFSDQNWKEGPGGFGSKGTPNSVVRTEWTSNDIWLRREFSLTEIPAGELQLVIYHDEDAEVFLNGKSVATLKGFNGHYASIPINRAALKKGRNVLAIHCHQSTGGQYIDAGLTIESPAANPE